MVGLTSCGISRNWIRLTCLAHMCVGDELTGTVGITTIFKKTVKAGRFPYSFFQTRQWMENQNFGTFHIWSFEQRRAHTLHMSEILWFMGIISEILMSLTFL